MLSKKEKLRIIKLNLPKSIYIPSIFISGSADWGMYQKPGDLEKMENVFLKNYYGRFIIKQAGHWVQQEQPNKTFDLFLKFLKKSNYYGSFTNIENGASNIEEKGIKGKKV